MLRTLDVIFSLIGLILGLPVIIVLLGLGYMDTGSPVFRQIRVGRYQKPFVLLKFRTMKINTPSVASHLADSTVVTRFGHFLRKTKLDELPQLWNVLIGEMSLVGPRPCLFNQEQLIQERASRGVFNARPGITGLAQVNNIDMSMPALLAKTDEIMLRNLSLKLYFQCLLMTVLGKGFGDRIKSSKK